MTRSESREQTRSAIVTTARELFLSEGFGTVPLERIAEAAGYTRGAVYSNFGDKAELGVAVLEGIHAERLRAAVAAISGATTPGERITDLREWSASTLADPAATVLECEVVAALRHRGDLRRRFATIVRRARSDFAAALRAIPTADGVAASPERLTNTVFALVIGVGVQRAVDPEFSTEAIDDALAAVDESTGSQHQFLNLVQKDGYADRVAEVEQDSETRPRGSSANRRGQQSRAAILSAARSAFSAKRFEEVSIAEIAAAAGVAAGSIGYHFGGKYELYLAVHEAVFEDFWDRLQELRGDPLDRMVRGFDIYLDFVQQHGISLVMTTRSGADERLTAQHEQHRDRLIGALLTEIVSAGYDPSLRIAIDGWLSFVEGATARWLGEPDPNRDQLRSLVLAAGFATLQTALALNPAITPTSRTIAALLEIDYASRPVRKEST
ncbi:TetR/AcrR family transcriptional regulator [Nocardia pseudovaccinii]|uniref:TetR/AcrR family transcriptional regulator n=1 Tax=Nocardia pseudovaccinii TaxID=189540 RepID=UPI003D9024CB